ncbi:anti-sigma factor family protein [Gorillibacterium sp. sgz5001074]|uniref:anti-sigma factor family protein n=1 Tax=Gorillibacterium sp. sgz5001074 TaxID=3446695 RepID=UPI003F673F1E
MNRPHPDDRTLELYRSCKLPETEADKIRLHMERCAACSAKLQALERLERHLHELSTESPGVDFTDRVMQALSASEVQVAARLNGENASVAKRRFGWMLRPELYNVLLATAATYLFVSTGILQAIFTVDSGTMEAGLYVRMLVVLEWVGRITHSLPS